MTRTILPTSGGNPLHILEIETFGRGGLIHYAYNLSLALADRQHRVTLVTADAYELEGRPLPTGVEVVRHFARRSRRLAERRFPKGLLALYRKVEAVLDARRLASLVRRLRPDVLHLHCTNPAALFHLRALAGLGIPLVATAHVVTPHEPIRFQGPVYRSIHRLPGRIIAHSRFDRQRLVDEFAVDPGRVAVIPHGEYGFFERVGAEGSALDRAEARRGLGLDEDGDSEDGDSKDRGVVLFFGYIREYKGLDLLLEAWPTVAAACPGARLVVAGDPVQLGPGRRRELEDWAQRVGAVHRFGYIPFEEVGRYFAAADVLVMPYRHISQSGVLYLALSLGLPVVATRVGALPELLSDGQSALLVPPEDPSALAHAVARLLADGALRERLAAGGRRLAEEHSWPAIAEQTEEVFRGLIGAHPGSS